MGSCPETHGLYTNGAAAPARGHADARRRSSPTLRLPRLPEKGLRRDFFLASCTRDTGYRYSCGTLITKFRN